MKQSQFTISVVGSGYVGTTTAALLAGVGQRVFAVDIDETKVALLNGGRAPFFEAGLNNLLATGVESGRLTATTNYQQSVGRSNVVVSSVGTPDRADGSPNLDYIFQALESVALSAQNDIIYVQKSTVPVGTGQKLIEHWAKLSSKKLTYVSAPEFLREGTAIADSLQSDRIVVGGPDQVANKLVADIFMQIWRQRAQISKLTKQKLSQQLSDPTVYSMSLESAELTKVTANAFLALKISFANTVAQLSDAAQADASEVLMAVGADTRIGKDFLSTGRGYGGGCFPKDVRGLITSSAEFGVDFDIMKAASRVNESMPGYMLNKLVARIGDIANKKVGLLGLAFKAGTSDARKSPGVSIANMLVQQGALVSAYDPEASQEAAVDLDSAVIIKDRAEDIIVQSEIIIIATEWPEFGRLDYCQTPVLVDAVNMLSSNQPNGPVYIGIGRS